MDKKLKDLTAYEQQFNEDLSSFTEFQASDYIKELKNQGQTDKAIEVGRTLLEQKPELNDYVNYFGYALYNRYINISLEKISENENLFYTILKEIKENCRQERYSPLEASVNKAIKYEMSKSPVDYSKLNELLDMLDGPTLDDQPFINKEGKEFESKKEKWYRQKVRALYETENYSLCLETANIAIASQFKWHYNNKSWIQYYRASSLVKLGRYEEAENTFIALKDHFRAADFSDILFQLYMNTGKENEAYTILLYEFFLNGFDIKLMPIYLKIQSMCKEKEASKQLSLINALLAKMKNEESEDYKDLDASHVFDKLYDSLMNHLELFIKRHEGKVVYYNEDKGFGTLIDHDQRIFFRQADYIYDEEVLKYDNVSYSLIKSYDRKKDESTYKAILLRTIY